MTTNSRKKSCDRCDYQNPPGALVCRRCYALLANQLETGSRPNTTFNLNRLNKTGLLGPSASNGAPVVESALPKETDRNTIVFKIMASAEEIRQPLTGGALLIGRQDRRKHIMPDIDLEPYDAYRYGVSRTHAQIYRQGNTVYLQDMGSANKTYLNEEQLEARSPAEVKNGDTIRLGAMVVHIRFE